MTTIAQLRRAALNLPAAEEGTHFGMVAFSVRGKGFASVTKDGLVQLRMSDEDTDAALAAYSTGERLDRMGKPIGFRMPLADIGGKDLNALVLQAWLHRAPRRLAARLDTPTDQAPAPDLPAAIGKPATRALSAAGLTTLDAVAGRAEAELLALHGVGPKAVRILAEELRRRGTSPG